MSIAVAALVGIGALSIAGVLLWAKLQDRSEPAGHRERRIHGKGYLLGWQDCAEFHHLDDDAKSPPASGASL